MRRTFGEWLKAVRKRVGLSHLELSRALGLINISTVCNVERGVNHIPDNHIMSYAAALKIDPEILAKMNMKAFDYTSYRILFEDS
ncbi:helix-turn-helix domain-containing protein [Sulfitobacter sp. M22]|uniref:helix-turn-helix domain-containing protein n=1 Tax=Sulfitobacter sp. M22 TaxID=2675332 RepID=UPI003FCE36FF